MGRTNDGKKKAPQQAEEPRVRRKSTRGSTLEGEGNSSRSQPTHHLSYSEAYRASNSQDAAWSDIFYREDRKNRYNFIKHFGFNQEKGFSDELKAVPEIYEELRRRKWLKFNRLMIKDNVIGNERLVREFFANAWKEPYDQHTDRAYVRGVMIDFSALALNEFLRAEIPVRCALETATIDFPKWPEVRRSVIKNFVGRPSTQWLKYTGGEFPTKIRLGDFKPVARAWAEFVVHNITPVSNSSEYQVENALAVKLIMEKKDINLGQWLVRSIRRIANNGQPSFTLGHCNLITALCKARGVPETDDDNPLLPIRAMTLRYFQNYDAGPVGAQPRAARARVNVAREEPEEDEEMIEIDRYESGAHPTQQQPPEIPRPTYSEDEVSALMTQLAIARACNVPHTFYSDHSLARLHAQHAIENAHTAARQLDEGERWQQDYDAYQTRHTFSEEDFGFDERYDGSGPSHQQ
ncbi:hypothetical protein TSUD_417750 [Trifolium subterraneum]|uniref:Putative plant transposon protein domain-containing protein n=1 Tax=Trifolium subterraneum TaxID=3900 RepID=A0A1B5Z8H0_TRISU|nr:hypothetical protein TSUD_417750 [Trifolium subterraneum]